jgi:hypothetical protein
VTFHCLLSGRFSCGHFEARKAVRLDQTSRLVW